MRVKKFKIVIRRKKMFGYDEPAHSFDCPLCSDGVQWDLDPQYVEIEAFMHIQQHHKVTRDIKIKHKWST